MFWEYIKKRWFTLALLFILLIAIVRKNIHLPAGDAVAPEPKALQEKYTEETSPAKGAALLQLGSDGTVARTRLPEIEEAQAVVFLKRFGRVAVAEQEKFGVPASVLLACAYVNSFAGQRDCALQANNFLAVPCTASWTGPEVTLSGVCYRQYQTAWESIRDFSLFLQRHAWFKELKTSAGNDWEAWAKGLAKHRVSDVDQFEKEITGVIKAYRLFELDEAARAK